MSLETARTEEPLPTGADAAQHAEPKPQLHSHSITLMSLAVTDYCETLAAESRLELDTDTDTANHVRVDTPPQLLESEPEPEADAQILEALRSAKDRLFVLKLGENMESLIQERDIRNRVELTPQSTYHKLLVHRCAAYYKLTPETEAGSKAIAITVASESRIPARRVADLVPPDDAPLPAFKIMRRTPQYRTRSKASSQGGSGNDDNVIGPGDLSDGDPSEAGSSRGSRKRPLTMSERQAQYDEARSRIFKDLEEKEKAKAQDMSASSSTLSLLSVGSSSGGAGEGGASSVGESLDETGSVDRDWVSAGGKDQQDGGRRTGSAASGSSRSLRSTAPAFNGHGHSPGFNYPTLYEPAPTPSTSSSSSYDSSPSSGSSHTPYQPTLYPVYQYGAPPYLAPYPYAYYPYPHPHPAPPPPPQHPPDSSATSGSDSPASSPADAYHPPVAFMNPYMWGAPPPPLPPHHQPQQQQQQHQQQQPQQQQQQHQQQQPQQQQQQQQLNPQRPMPSQPEFTHPQYPSAPMHAYTYPAPVPPAGYLHPHPPPVQQQQQPQPSYPHNPGRSQSQGPLHGGHRATNLNPGLNHVNGTSSQPQLYQPGGYDGTAAGGALPVAQNGGNGGGIGTGQKRVPPRSGSGWSFGPGVGGAGVGMAGEVMGPRMSTGRRTSGGTSVASGYAGSRTPGDETASTASSSTSSSSSRQTFTSTSSKHPLPARPDWAVGLKPQPTLSQSSSHHSSPRSHHGHLPSQSHGHHQRPPLPTSLQSNDFPPLTVSPPKPVLGGVWAGSSTTRSILGPSLGRLNNGNGPGVNINGHGSTNGNGVMLPGQGAAQQQQNTRLDEHDRAFERPGPKVGGELFNPNGGGGGGGGARVGAKSPPRKVSQGPPEKERADKDKASASARGEAIANAILVDRVGALRIGQDGAEQDGGDGTG